MCGMPEKQSLKVNLLDLSILRKDLTKWVQLKKLGKEPWQSSGYDPLLPKQEAWVQSLGQGIELRSPMPSAMAKVFKS